MGKTKTNRASFLNYKNLFRLIFYIALLIMLSTCGGDVKVEEGSTGGSSGSSSESTVIPSTTKVLDDTTTQKLSSVSSDGSTLTFSENTTQLQSLKSGDVIAVNVTSLTPYGLLRKVTSVSTSGNQVTVQTTQATITDAIQKGTIQLSKTLTQSDI
ncbi:MAG: hypothetical protein HY754_03315 [Nitrospirae bacterium]|nr:hypothetical protein [Nitrospirota bacterium]